MKNAITVLTRGYHNLKAYDSLITRNKAISQFIGNKYPLLIFQEGNITNEHQQYIKEQTPELDIQFIDISPVWVGGYESMCRFHGIHLWEYCKDYDNIMRIDEDCIIQECPNDPFELIGDNVFLRSVYFAESHSETNATLPKRLEELTGSDKKDFYNDRFVYTNVCVSSVGFWLEENMYELLKKICLSPEQLENRWGDLPVLGSLLNMFAKGRVGHINGLVYKHLSHNNTITSNGID